MLEVGFIAKAHGLKGHVIVGLITNRIERLEPGSKLFLNHESKLVVASSKPHGHRFLVKFKGINSREEAQSLHGKTLLGEPIEDADAMWVHEMIGKKVVSGGELVGVVASMLPNPAGDILELEDGRLIPLRFVVSSSETEIEIDPPEGLLDL